MLECYATIERGDFSSSTAASIGAAANCPFCAARGTKIPHPGEQILFLHGSRAGSVARVSDAPNKADANGFLAALDDHSANRLERVSLDRDLFAALPLSAIPDWRPPFNLRRSFIIDELAVWFANRGHAGGGFHWKRGDIAVVVQGCWQKKLAITPTQLSAVLMAHGMPPNRQSEFEDFFEFGIASLVRAAGRKAVKKWRDPFAMRDEFSAAMRQWGK